MSTAEYIACWSNLLISQLMEAILTSVIALILLVELHGYVLPLSIALSYKWSVEAARGKPFMI